MLPGLPTKKSTTVGSSQRKVRVFLPNGENQTSI